MAVAAQGHVGPQHQGLGNRGRHCRWIRQLRIIAIDLRQQRLGSHLSGSRPQPPGRPPGALRPRSGLVPATTNNQAEGEAQPHGRDDAARVVSRPPGQSGPALPRPAPRTPARPAPPVRPRRPRDPAIRAAGTAQPRSDAPSATATAKLAAHPSHGSWCSGRSSRARTPAWVAARPIRPWNRAMMASRLRPCMALSIGPDVLSHLGQPQREPLGCDRVGGTAPHRAEEVVPRQRAERRHLFRRGRPPRSANSRASASQSGTLRSVGGPGRGTRRPPPRRLDRWPARRWPGPGRGRPPPPPSGSS